MRKSAETKVLSLRVRQVVNGEAGDRRTTPRNQHIRLPMASNDTSVFGTDLNCRAFRRVQQQSRRHTREFKSASTTYGSLLMSSSMVVAGV